MAQTSKRASEIRKKQITWLLIIGAVIALLSLIGSWVATPSGEKIKKAEKPQTRQITLGGASSDKEAWRVQSSAQLEAMLRRLSELERKEKSRMNEEKREEEKKRQNANNSNNQELPIAPPAPNKPLDQNIFNQVGQLGPLVPPPTRSSMGEIPSSSDIPLEPRIKTVQITSEQSIQADKEVNDEMINSARRFGATQSKKRDANSDGKERIADDDPLSYNRAGGRSAESYLPAGTFVRAALLNGLDAATGGQAQQNPHPVLLQILDNAQLPNNFRANLKGCVVTGNGHGDLSAERAYVRLDRMSCIDDEGGAIDISIRGYVSGEDGKTGMRGRLITKTGQVIANAILVGTIGGIGDAIRQSATTQNENAYGGQSTNVNNPWKYGVGGGVGKAMDRVAQYYIKLADKLFPVVEVDAGRVVDIVLTRGVSIERK